MQIDELLKVLDMSGEEQKAIILDLCHESPPYKGRFGCSLADLAFRLRDEVKDLPAAMIDNVVNVEETPWRLAMALVWGHCSKFSNHNDFWTIEAKPIHWIVAALIAKEMAKEKK